MMGININRSTQMSIREGERERRGKRHGKHQVDSTARAGNMQRNSSAEIHCSSNRPWKTQVLNN